MNTPTMNSDSADIDKRRILDSITQTIFAVSDEIPPSQKIKMGTLLVADLGLESIQIANLFFRLNAHYSGAVSLADLIVEATGAGWQGDMSVGGLVDFIAASLQAGRADARISPEPGGDRKAL